MSKDVLLVPIHLDALFLPEEESVLDPMADFSRLPYYDRNKQLDVNPNVAYLSDEIVPHPFQDQGFRLKRGVHLHWALPDALTQGVNNEGTSPDGKAEKSMVFPVVPDRWLVTRSKREANSSSWKKQWVVESDFLYPEGASWQVGSISFPVNPNREQEKYAEYDLRLMSAVDRADELNNEGHPVVIIALLGDDLHLRIFDTGGKKVVDKPENELVSGKTLIALKQRVKNATGNNPRLSPEDKREIIEIAISLAGHTQPFRYMGRKVSIEHWNKNKETSNDEYFNSLTADGLTAMAYGEPSFAAFYPNCHSVFGLHDERIVTEDEFKSVRYDVIGWYSNPRQDCLRTTALNQAATAIQQRVWREFLASGEDVPPLNKLNEELSDDLKDWYAKHIPRLAAHHEALAKHYEWSVSDKSKEPKRSFPKRSFFYAVLQPVKKPVFKSKETSSVKVAIGNTGTEALSVFLARHLANQHAADQLPANQSIIEEQLESLNLAHRLNHRQLDIGPKFLEARHGKGFKATGSGILWTVRPQSNHAAVKHPESTAPVTLPAYLAHPLNQLNEAQRRYDKAQQEIVSLRRQVYDDWTLFMMASHPPAWLNMEFPDPAEVSHFMQRTGILTLKKKLAHTGSVTFERKDLSDAFMVATTPPHVAETSLAALVKKKVDELVEALKVANQIESYHQAIERDITAKQKAIAAATEESPARKDANELAESFAKELMKVAKLESLPAIPTTLPISERLSKLRDRIRIKAIDLPKKDKATEFRKALEKLPLPPEVEPNAEFRYALQNVEAPRFYQPCDPVVLLAGNAVRPTERHGTDSRDKDGKLKLLQCKPLSLEKPIKDNAQPNKETLKLIRDTVLRDLPDGDQIGARHWQEQPWHPFLMEWQVEIFPRKKAGNLGSDRKTYGRSFITHNYKLPDRQVDLVTRPEAVRIAGSNDTGVYSGSCILTDYAPLLLKEQLASYLKPKLKSIRNAQLQVEKYVTERKKPDGTDDPKLRRLREAEQEIANYLSHCDVERGRFFATTDSLSEALQRIAEYLQTRERALGREREALQPLQKAHTQLASFLNPALATLAETQKFFEDPHYIMSQALGGFHEALLQHHQSLLLPIRDPQGFADFRWLTEAVRAIAEHRVTGAPLRGNDFMPIRSGQMKLRQLRLVDTFGRVKSLIEPGNAEPVATTEVMQSIGSPHLINLTPRLVQPARINFRWLSEHATGTTVDEPETNAHPASTPVCGWMVPNNLDGTLLIYDNRGRALGTIAERMGHAADDEPTDGNANDRAELVWEPAPVNGLPTWDILNADSSRINPHLRKLVDTIVHGIGKQEPSFLRHFIASLDNALETIAPEAAASHEARALLMGRPIAVVRAMVDLELRGRPAINQNLPAFWQDMVRGVEPTEDTGQGPAERALFKVTGKEAATLRRALREQNAAKTRPIFERRSIILPAALTISDDHDGGHLIHLSTHNYHVVPADDTLHILLDNDRSIDGFTQVKFPIRIGEYQQLNDGLVGYWKEEPDDKGYHYQGNMFYAPQGAELKPLVSDVTCDLAGWSRELNRRRLPDAIRRALEAQKQEPLAAGAKLTVTTERTGQRWRVDAGGRLFSIIMGGRSLHLFEASPPDNPSKKHIQVHGVEPINLYQSIDDPPQKLTMLVDLAGWSRELNRRRLPDAIRRALEAQKQEPLAAGAKVTVTTERTGQRWRVDAGGRLFLIIMGGRSLHLFEASPPDNPSKHIQVHGVEPINLYQSIDDPPQKLTMLVDPHGPVHAVSGILPTKSIEIPPDQYAETLKKLEVSFLTAPILTGPEKLAVPLPDEPGYQWSWLDREGGRWRETGAIEKIDSTAQFSGQQRVVEGWLKLRREKDN